MMVNKGYHLFKHTASGATSRKQDFFWGGSGEGEAAVCLFHLMFSLSL